MRCKVKPKKPMLKMPPELDITLEEIMRGLLLPQGAAAFKRYIPTKASKVGKMIAAQLSDEEKLLVWEETRRIYAALHQRLLRVTTRFSPNIRSIKYTLGESEGLFRKFLLLWAVGLHISNPFEYYALGKQARAENANPYSVLISAEKASKKAYAARAAEHYKVSGFIGLKLRGSDCLQAFHNLQAEMHGISTELTKWFAWLLMHGYQQQPTKRGE